MEEKILFLISNLLKFIVVILKIILCSYLLCDPRSLYFKQEKHRTRNYDDVFHTKLQWSHLLSTTIVFFSFFFLNFFMKTRMMQGHTSKSSSWWVRLTCFLAWLAFRLPCNKKMHNAHVKHAFSCCTCLLYDRLFCEWICTIVHSKGAPS